MTPRTTCPMCDASGVMVTLIVPVAPGPSTSGLNVMVPKVTSCHQSPLSAVTAASKAFSCATTLVLTSVVGAPPGPNGPTRVGSSSHCPQGTSGTVSDAATASGPIERAVRSGAMVKPTKKPLRPKASMVIGAPACAVNCALRVCVGSTAAQQPKGSCVIGLPFPSRHAGAVPKARVVQLLSRASAKYAWAKPPLLVIVMGTM